MGAISLTHLVDKACIFLSQYRAAYLLDHSDAAQTAWLHSIRALVFHVVPPSHPRVSLRSVQLRIQSHGSPIHNQLRIQSGVMTFVPAKAPRCSSLQLKRFLLR